VSASALFVFGVGVALAFFLVPVVNWLQRHGLPRWIARAPRAASGQCAPPRAGCGAGRRRMCLRTSER
jgi:hypothetical protein